MADPTSDVEAHKKIENRILTLVQQEQEQDQENHRNGGNVGNHFSNNLIRSCSIDKFLKVGLLRYLILRLSGLQFFSTVMLPLLFEAKLKNIYVNVSCYEINFSIVHCILLCNLKCICSFIKLSAYSISSSLDHSGKNSVHRRFCKILYRIISTCNHCQKTTRRIAAKLS